jgi:hypothetical protein
MSEWKEEDEERADGGGGGGGGGRGPYAGGSERLLHNRRVMYLFKNVIITQNGSDAGIGRYWTRVQVCGGVRARL